jgi:hypothetical protein
VLLALLVFVGWYLRRHRSDALRWLAAPPGPPRPLPELRRWERWATSRRVALALAGILVLTMAAGTVVVIFAD